MTKAATLCCFAAFQPVHGFMQLRQWPGRSTTSTANSLVDVDHRVQELKEELVLEHQKEFDFGKAVFGSSSEVNSGTRQGQSFDDNDFHWYDVGEGNFGPVSDTLKYKENSRYIFETKDQVLTPVECEYFIDSARITIKDKLSAQNDSMHDAQGKRALTNSDLGEARLSALPEATLDHLRKVLNTRLYPLIQSRFGDENDFTLYDGLILGSIAPSRSQPVHRDASFVTLNIPLSAPQMFRGGGTYIEPLDDGFASPLVIERGKALCHLSSIRHAGTGIDAGERWVLVMFLLAKEEPQIARRCHANGLEALDENDLARAKSYFEAGLQEAPTDFLLHLGRAQVASIEGDERLTYRSLNEATKNYPLHRKAMVAKGNMLLAKKRPRAALRQFETLLGEIKGRDEATTWISLKALSWEARAAAARACMLCAEREAARKVVESQTTRRPWAETRLPIAMDWLNQCLAHAPGDQRLVALYSRAEELLRHARNCRYAIKN